MSDGWLDDAEPFDRDTHEQQLAAIRAQVDPGSRILDIGCGAGRLSIPLTADGHDVVGIERNEELAARAAAGGTVLVGEFPAMRPEGTFDAVLLLGNLLSTYVDVREAAALLTEARSMLRSGGVVFVDDIPGMLWPELSEGNWLSGVTDDGEHQLVWAEDDAVFALRSGDAVRPDDWSPGPDDRCFRLWTLGSLRLLARISGFSDMTIIRDGYLIALH